MTLFFFIIHGVFSMFFWLTHSFHCPAIRFVSFELIVWSLLFILIFITVIAIIHVTSFEKFKEKSLKCIAVCIDLVIFD